MRIQLLILVLSLVSNLSACVSYHIGDNDVMKPDRLTGYQTRKSFDQQELNEILPNARLREESIVISPEIKLGGLSILQDNAKVSVLYFLGGGDHVDRAARSIAKLATACPMNVSFFDYRGFGRSSGEHTMDVMKQDALRIYDEFRKKTHAELIVHGYSMGSFLAGHIAQQRQVDGLILQATANTMEAVIHERIPAFVRAMVRFKLDDGLQKIDNVKAVSNYEGRSLVISGEIDVQTPPILGKLVFDAIPSKDKNWVLVKAGTHSNLLRSEEVKSAYCELLNQNAITTDRD